MWLPLAEYSMKHKVSISTLRRRIKAEDIQYRLEDGKYFIFDTDPTATTTTTVENRMSNPTVEAHRPSLKSDSSAVMEAHQKAEGESVITAANRLLTDLKKAYTQVLQEKEEQIVSLKEEITDLRTLVRVLESENQRLNQKNNPQYTGYSQQNLDY
ncbi:hypothetical protein [Pseudobdellovibrio sp. HCB154]|uniref:hypothetical protein n=1 Tax=Pseudobdellovibrio sp. HCB154 TaxID=3386277 RepID=UPI003916DEF2